MLTPFLVTYRLKTVLVLAVNEVQALAYCKLRFGSKNRYLIVKATEWQVDQMKALTTNSMFTACIPGGKKE